MSDALPITASLTIPAAELEWRADRASGPGGQNVNKVASKVTLWFDLARSAVLTPGARERLRQLAGSRLDVDGRLRIVSSLTRDQGRNLEDARAKLRELILRALEPPRPRRPTKPTRGSQRRRLESKRKQSSLKRQRSSFDD